MAWTSVWAIFSQAHLVTLNGERCEQGDQIVDCLLWAVI
jgi:hypothetical protein